MSIVGDEQKVKMLLDNDLSIQRSNVKRENMKDYLKEQNSEENARSKRPLICPPNPHNITPIYASLMEFIGVIESALKVSLICI